MPAGNDVVMTAGGKLWCYGSVVDALIFRFGVCGVVVKEMMKCRRLEVEIAFRGSSGWQRLMRSFTVRR